MARKTQQSLKAGTYTAGDLMREAGFDFEKEAAADYLQGKPDFRRVRVGGLAFDSLEETVVVPYTANEVVVTLDGKEAAKLAVELDDEQKELRARSFESAADADDE